MQSTDSGTEADNGMNTDNGTDADNGTDIENGSDVDNGSDADNGTDGGSKSEDASSRQKHSGPSGKVKCTTNFTSFSGAYQFSLNQIFCNMREDLTLDELSNKINRLHDLRTSLLPSLKPQLVAILESLDLSEQPVYPCPNPELTAKILSELYSSIGKTISGVEYLALAPPLAKESHDGHLKELKRFRINRILWKTKAVIHENLCDLLETFGLWLLDWDLTSRSQIDAVLEWATLSDLAILQQEWRGSREKTDSMLQALSEILKGTYVRKQKPDRDQDEGADTNPEETSEEKKVHQARAIQLAQWAIPIVKLTRIFYTKLSNAVASNQLPFTLDPEISSKEHGSLREKVDSFYSRIDQLLGHLCVIYETEENIDTKIRSLRQVTLQSLADLDQALLALAFYMVPLPTAAGPSAMQRDFKACFFALKSQLLVAGINLRDAASTCFGEVDDSDSD
ncbi:hypothetical protein PCASD_01864 [Puccinia coronata f. sp. avenae]|uniref:Uncharacterized protein n=1 Tax=Puccinia coronata f. sp. avenae TaxID=200324 RepID=A0A2N5VJK3_9BASI|nr:hypothetical protein PCASD_01864 [Puccinia coronata f. sp. avenae]